MRSIVCGAVLAAGAVFAPVHAHGRLADVTVIDRETGRTLEMHYWRGEYWVAGEAGGRYGIQLHNRTGGRLLAVMSVDGVNVVSGETAGWDQVGYVLSAHDGYQITGWRKSDSIVAAFGFTAATNSYAERTGRPQNVGVIGVALFRERPQEPPPLVPPLASNSSPAASSPSPPSADSSARASEPVESARAGGASGGLASNAINSPVAPSLGTAHGEREVSYTYHTTFTRLHTQPDEIVRVRYDSREKLIALGIIPPHLPPPTAPDPFPGSAGSYVPDPPAG